MPTGYTCKLCDGPQTFEDFALGCARAFGALVTMRDEDPSTPIPKEFKPEAYHAEQSRAAQLSLARFKAMSEDKAERLAIAEYDAAVTAYHERREKNRNLRDRLGAMKRDVRAWVPPTPDHAGLKDFMFDQIEKTAEFDGRDFGDKPRLVSGADYRLAGIEKAVADIAYHERAYKEEAARCKGRSEWIRELRDSLTTKAAI